MSIKRQFILDRDRPAHGDEILPRIHPGKILKEEFLEPLGISQSQLASDLGISFRRVHEIVNGKRGITAETALLLGKYFGMTAEFWIGLQSHYDLEAAWAAMAQSLSRVRVLERPDLDHPEAV